VAEKSQILIVEDDLDLSEMLNAYFRVQGYDVLTAAWGKDAVRLSREHSPDLVVLDIRLPDIDGYEVCRQLRTNRRTQDIPVIFLTEKRDRVDKLQGLELGVVDYITKPFDIQELRLRVRNSLRRAAQQTLVNPVTNLPEGRLVQEKLRELLSAPQPWGVLTVWIQGLEQFMDRYGFVAADDVLRAVTLMINNAIREVGSEGDFVGHLSPHDFILVTKADTMPTIHDRMAIRLKQSMEYFYPLKDRDEARRAMAENRLAITLGQVSSVPGPFKDIDALTDAIRTGRPTAE
jgi:DNA-binding response OmpR family regulator